MAVMLLLITAALAGDTWTNIRPGVDYLHRTTSDPQDIYATRIDLSLPNVALHASADNSSERGVNTRTFADAVGALVAINTDWSNGYTPVGLAISDGAQWHGHIPDNTLGGHWGVVGCTIQKDCSLFVELPLDTAWWFGQPTLSPYRYHNASGANGIPMVQDGAAASGCYDGSLNPRSALCMEADGVHMWMIVVDGRSGIADGMTCDGIRDLMLEFGCYQGVMLDGGGSSTLVIEGDVKNNPSDGSLRSVSNHLAVLYRDSTDPACVQPNGKWCEGTTIHACQGGQRTGSGDCAVYGATCQQDGDYAFCVDYRCPGGDGLGAACLDASRVASCTDGQYGEGDCAVFGLACGTDAGGSACMDPRCPSPDGSACLSGASMVACTDGAYAEVACAAGTTCAADALGAWCGDDRCPPEGGICEGDTFIDCARGVYSATDCALQGMTCRAGTGCVAPGDSSDPGDDSGGAGEGGPPVAGLPGSVEAMPAGGCDATGGSGFLSLWIGAALLRRRRPGAHRGRSPGLQPFRSDA